MWDIVDLDDEAIEEYASNELLGQFLSNTVFRTGILCVILFNSILIAVETDQELVSTIPSVIKVSNLDVFTPEGEQGWQRVLASHQCGLGLSLAGSHMWVEFDVGSRPCSEGFSPGTPVFLPLRRLLLARHTISPPQ